MWIQWNRILIHTKTYVLIIEIILLALRKDYLLIWIIEKEKDINKIMANKWIIINKQKNNN